MSEQGRLFRDDAIEQVKENSGVWFENAMLAAIMALKDDPLRHWTGEDVRYAIHDQTGEPHTYHVWGALVMNLYRQEYLVKTGKIGQMRSPRSHAHNTPIYVSAWHPDYNKYREAEA